MTNVEETLNVLQGERDALRAALTHAVHEWVRDAGELQRSVRVCEEALETIAEWEEGDCAGMRDIAAAALKVLEEEAG